MMGLDAGLGLLFFATFGVVYAIWFKRPRATFGFLWLIWLVLGLSAVPLLAAIGVELDRDLGPVTLGWLPWNFLLLACLPRVRLVSAAAVALVLVLILELVLPLFIPLETWRQAPGLDARIQQWLPGQADLLTPVGPMVLVIASIGFFLRWQMSGRTTELALSLTCTILLLGVMRPGTLVVAISGASAVLFLGVVYTTHRMAFVDALTGLPNRRSLDLTLGSMPRRYAIAMLDIDHFKRVNDRFGHDFGDQVLRMVASRLRRGRGYRAYRYGGEEFCLLFLGGDRTDAAQEVCEQVRQTIADLPMAFRGRQRPAHRPVNKGRYREKVPGIKVTVSIGLALGDRTRDADAVIEAADKALYRAKRAGRDRVVKSRK